MSELIGIVRFKFHDGRVEEFKRLSARAMEIVRAQDTGTLQYDTYFNDDESEAIVIERFRDSQALIEHGEHLAALMEPIIATASVSGELLGELSPELRAKMTGDNPQLFRLYKSDVADSRCFLGREGSVAPHGDRESAGTYRVPARPSAGEALPRSRLPASGRDREGPRA
jgi:quinol monooxygenase YgiN